MRAAAVIAFIAAAALTAASKLAEEEIKGWIEVLPGIVLRMAAMQLHVSQRITIHSDEWLPELLFITRRADGSPLTRFILGMKFSLGLLRSSRRVAVRLRRVQRSELASVRAAEPEQTPASPSLGNYEVIVGHDRVDVYSKLLAESMRAHSAHDRRSKASAARPGLNAIIGQKLAKRAGSLGTREICEANSRLTGTCACTQTIMRRRRRDSDALRVMVGPRT